MSGPKSSNFHVEQWMRNKQAEERKKRIEEEKRRQELLSSIHSLESKIAGYKSNTKAEVKIKCTQ